MYVTTHHENASSCAGDMHNRSAQNKRMYYTRVSFDMCACVHVIACLWMVALCGWLPVAVSVCCCCVHACSAIIIAFGGALLRAHQQLTKYKLCVATTAAAAAACGGGCVSSCAPSQIASAPTHGLFQLRASFVYVLCPCLST